MYTYRKIQYWYTVIVLQLVKKQFFYKGCGIPTAIKKNNLNTELWRLKMVLCSWNQAALYILTVRVILHLFWEQSTNLLKWEFAMWNSCRQRTLDEQKTLIPLGQVWRVLVDDILGKLCNSCCVCISKDKYALITDLPFAPQLQRSVLKSQEFNFFFFLV